MYIRKTKNGCGTYDISIEEESKLLKIYQSELGLHFACRYNNFQNFSIISFSIKEKHENLYPLFLTLYESIMELKQEKEKIASSLPKREQETLVVASLPVINEESITIMSDAHPLHSPYILAMHKGNDRIVLYFVNEGKEKKVAQQEKKGKAIMVQINHRDSRLGEFAIPFRILFETLQEVPDSKLEKDNLHLLSAGKGN